MGTANTLKIYAYFTDSGVPKTGLTPTINIWKTNGTAVVNAGTMNEMAGGFYYYDFSTSDNSINYTFRADGGATLSGYDRYVHGTNEIDRVNSEVWEEATSDHTTVGSMGLKQLQIQSTGGVLNTGIQMEFKKILDNMVDKKEIKLFFDKLSQLLDKNTEEEKSKNDKEKIKVSKMSSDINDKINQLNEQSKNNPKLINSIKSDLKQLSNKINDSDKSFEKVTQFNKDILNMIKLIQNKELLEINNKIKSTTESVNEVKEINQSNTDQLITGIKNISDNIKQMSDTYNMAVSKFQSDGNATKEDVLKEFTIVKEEFNKLSEQVEHKKVELIINTKCDSMLVEQNKKNNEHLRDEIGKDISQNYEQVNKMFEESNSKLSEIDTLLKSDSSDKNVLINGIVDKISIKVDDLGNSINGIGTDVNSIMKLTNDFLKLRDSVREMGTKLADKRDINYISSEVDNKFSKLNKQVISMRDVIKDKLIEISKKADIDDSDIDSQLKLLGLDRKDLDDY